MNKFIAILLSLLFSTMAYGQRPGFYRSIADALKDPLGTKELTLYGIDTTEISEDILRFENLEEIEIDNCPKINFRSALKKLSLLKHLRSLQISGCELSKLPTEIGELKTLRSLDISDNNLIYLPVELLSLSELRDVDLGKNLSLNIDSAINILKKLSTLKELSLDDNKLSKLPLQITGIVSLRRLSLNGNQFTDMPSPLRKMNIEYLYLFQNKINKLSLKHGDLPNLTDINLCYNKFTRFPVELSVCPKLKWITIWNNKIRRIPKEIGNFKVVDSINIDNNRIRELPLQIGSLKTLKHFSAQFNKLNSKSITPVYQMSNLLSLGLDGNNIKKIGGDIDNLTKLKYFNISSNPVKYLPAEIASLKEVIIMGLNDMHFLDWESTFSVLEKMPKLKRLGLSEMGITKMPDSFTKLRKLDEIYLRRNNFSREEWIRVKGMIPNTKID